ncbi:dGTPase inhibitor [Klebsiella phage Mera]|nr:dGTPase inhibitor [Klebsiella phage Mera]
MATEKRWLFDGSISQWSRLGATERRLLEVTDLHIVMLDDPFTNTVLFNVFEPSRSLLISKRFSHWSIDSASDWLAKLTADSSSWK